MVMTKIELNVPSGAEPYVVGETNEKMRNALLLYPSIVSDTISFGKAAELLGMYKTELIQIYGSLGIPYLDMTDEEFTEEVQTVKRLVRAEI